MTKSVFNSVLNKYLLEVELDLELAPLSVDVAFSDLIITNFIETFDSGYNYLSLTSNQGTIEYTWAGLKGDYNITLAFLFNLFDTTSFTVFVDNVQIATWSVTSYEPYTTVNASVTSRATKEIEAHLETGSVIQILAVDSDTNRGFVHGLNISSVNQVNSLVYDDYGNPLVSKNYYTAKAYMKEKITREVFLAMRTQQGNLIQGTYLEGYFVEPININPPLIIPQEVQVRIPSRNLTGTLIPDERVQQPYSSIVGDAISGNFIIS